ncbi:PAS sensor protein [Mangrovactinospora gilvigrisea]|uniref:PAS sensor protein n=1 Tax=Mangrovactinospora gilvigrisea TaxID=1428644 RepID=A0A1J7BP95_9ACTN|nr:SpoIIE family protein phosphatase [Mangrovactinospora gilvigrisea]OIV35265.1 PAS sensor protein [Mangrovactinospora gilvigrisea]
MNLTRWSARLPGTTRRRPAEPRPAAVPPARQSAAEGGPADPALRDVLAHAPAPIAVTDGPQHRITYVNEAYTAMFGPRTPGAPAREALPELDELGVLPLMDQVYRSGRARTVRVRRVAQPTGTPADDTPDEPDATGDSAAYYSFVCAPITDHDAPAGHANSSPAPRAVRRLARNSSAAGRVHGVLVFATEVTDQVQATERLRESERRHRETAVTLQRSLLPQELEQPDDLRVAAVYHPGGAEAAVGGDWYDVITLGGGRTALVIGDVMGRGVRAAAVMGQLRTAVRAYARLDLPPHEVLQLLDGLATEIDASQIATCTYAVYDPGEARIVHASAGHLPMIIRDEDGTVRRVEHQAGPPLGTGGYQHTSEEVPLLPGSTAVLYTDGLVERRGQDIDDGITELESAVAGAAGGPDVVCDRLLRAMGITEQHDDDVAVLVVQLPGRTPEQNALFRGATLELHGGTEAAPRARAFTTGVLASWRLSEDLRELGVLAVSELVANCLTHGSPPMRLRLRRTHRRLIVEVSDGNEQLPRRRTADVADESGRGLGIVAAIAAGWGSRRTPDGGKSVWCEFDLPGDHDLS